MDSKGVLGFPMRIAAAFLIISVCTPALISLADGFQQESDLGAMEDDVSGIISAAGRAYYGGAGSSCSADVSIPAGYEIVIGGSEGDAYAVSVTDGSEVLQKSYTERPAVKFHGNGIAVSGNCRLVFECGYDNGIYGVWVSVA